ncbi:adenylosuccinate synthetase [Bacteroidia bacterium]|nr:adenylosuccinate synthetase [Bacteroidia bacterium]
MEKVDYKPAKVDVLLGLQWGDEGKGKVVDVLTPKYDIITRFQGGPNAGHTLEFEGKKFVLRSVPSGIFQEGKINVIGNGVVLDPILFQQETESLIATVPDISKRLHISRKAHLILPTHRMLDAAHEAAKGASKIGTTGKGIGPTYTDKAARNGVRVGDIENSQFIDRYNLAKSKHETTLRALNYPCDTVDMGDLEKEWFKAVEYLKTFTLIDSETFLYDSLLLDKHILAEGAQGTMLDVDFGSYPFVTSSNTTCAGACSGLGIPPNKIGTVYGLFKAYCTRVGSGPFPTELTDETGKMLAERGREFGSVTGRPRRCGWLDLVALQYAIRLNGVSKLIMMKNDVLDTLDIIKVCVGYEINGAPTHSMPYELTDKVKPIYKELKGWKTDMTQITSEKELPKEFIDYIRFIEENALGGKIEIVSVGPDRKQTINMS